MEPIYYPDHAERYAHLPPRERWKYPDEVRLGMFRYKREKTLAELREDVVNGKIPCDGGDLLTSLLLAAKDIPVNEACYDGGGSRG